MNHRGNVTLFYTFGSSIVDMSFTSDTTNKYRYGFNNQEKDDEIGGDGDYYAFENRIHDARLGRFLSIDPLVANFPFWSPYCFAANSPIYFLDALGNEPAGGSDPPRGQPTVRRGLAYNNNFSLFTRFNTNRIKLTVQNANSNNKIRNRTLVTPSPPSVRPPVYAQFNLGNEGGMSSPGAVDYYSAFIEVKNLAIQIKDLLFIETIKTNSQGVATVFFTAALDKQSESYMNLEAKQKNWQDGLNVELQKIYAKEPKFDKTAYDKLQTEDEKKAFMENYTKQKAEYVINLKSNIVIATLIYIFNKGKSPNEVFQEKAIDFYNKNKDKLTETKVETFEQPVIYATPIP